MLIKTNKLKVALNHLQMAIDLFLSKKDLFCVITLAGAAEEILGQYATRADETKMVDLLCSSLAQNHSTDISNCKFKKSCLNIARNTLKHFDSKDSEIIEIDPENEAITMLLRAVGNLYFHDKSVTHNTPQFLLWIIDNRKDLYSKK